MLMKFQQKGLVDWYTELNSLLNPTIHTNNKLHSLQDLNIEECISLARNAGYTEDEISELFDIPVKELSIPIENYIDTFEDVPF